MATTNLNSNGTAPNKPQSAAARLRTLLSSPSSLTVCPDVYDGRIARIALQAGFQCLYMTGAGIVAPCLGMSDLGLVLLPDMVQNASVIASLDRTVPLMVGRTVQAYMTAGIAGMHLEDQVVTKRCRHLSNKELVDENAYLARIRAVVMAREEMRQTVASERDIVIIARTDALQGLGDHVAIQRLKRVIEVGAGMTFLEVYTTIEQGKQACRDLAPTPVLLNSVPGSVTTDRRSHRRRSSGFGWTSYPAFALGPVYEHVSKAAEELMNFK